jgi:hypothetical protein
MNTLSSKLRTTIRDHIDKAPAHEIRAITALLCSEEQVTADNDNGAAAAPATRFQVRDEIVVDRATGLTWTRGNVGDKRLTHEEAVKACAELQLDGGGWRLATIKELLSLVDYERHDPAIDPAFKCDSAWYWTATPAASVSFCAWGVYFDVGGASWRGRDSGGFVRAVRGGQF